MTRCFGPNGGPQHDYVVVVAITCRKKLTTERMVHMEQFGVYSEVGKLRKVIVHRPELSLKRLTPSNHDDLLFDDVLWVERAQWEHDQFVAAMRSRGIQVFLLLDLLGEALAARDEARRKVIEQV